MFLATTALTDFWDPREEVLCLGSWCLRQDQRRYWAHLRFRVMPSPWNDRERFYEAADYVDGCGERMLERLANYLNAVHGVAYPLQSWRVLLGSWLLSFLHAAYDRYVHLTEAFQQAPNLRTLVLDPRSFRVPQEPEQARGWLHDDFANLQLFSQLLAGMGHAFPARGRAAPEDAVNGACQSPRRVGIRRGEDMVRRALRRRWKVGLQDVCRSRMMSWSLAWKTAGRVMPLEVSRDWGFALPDARFDEARNGLSRLPSGDPFERLVMPMLPFHLPTLFLEGYRQAREEVRRRYPAVPAVLVATNTWYSNSPFRFLAAEVSAGGGRLISVQHGGGYGLYRFSPIERHEARLSDAFLVWGWAGDHHPICRNLPSPNLSALTRTLRHAPAARDGAFLFVTTAHPRYLYQFQSTPVGGQVEEYFRWQRRFLDALPERVRRRVLFRPYPHDYGHAVEEGIRERFPEVRWQPAVPIHRQFAKARLVIVDHSATVFLETLAANIPTVLFWDPRRWEVRAEAAPYLHALREAGILWDEPEAAAGHVATVCDQPQAWWRRTDVRQARHQFVERYALVDRHWASRWSDTLSELPPPSASHV
ncbi:MAG: hypothetical protein HY595_00650 [Candidatus Omnitrophica bacterium]|nr:hypothetical protein [Candidatus Omnitrophota bacterium]